MIASHLQTQALYSSGFMLSAAGPRIIDQQPQQLQQQERYPSSLSAAAELEEDQGVPPLGSIDR